MYIVGLTGGIGSGKSAATGFFSELGITIVDTDIISRQVVQPGTPALTEIAHHFGEEILLGDGNLNRSALREIIFSKPQEKDWLENLLFPAIRKETGKQLDASDSLYTILCSALLLEMDQSSQVNRVLVIDVPREKQIQRTLARDNSGTETIEAIMASQISREKRLKLANDIICNDKDLLHLEAEVRKQHQIYCKYLEEKLSGEQTNT